MEEAQRTKVLNIVGWSIFCVCLVIGALLGLGGTIYGIVVSSHPEVPEVEGWVYFAAFFLISWMFGALIGWIGWAIKRSLTKTDRN